MVIVKKLELKIKNQRKSKEKTIDNKDKHKTITELI